MLSNSARRPVPPALSVWLQRRLDRRAVSDRPGVESTLAGLGLQLRWATGVAQALGELREHPSMLCLLDCTRGGEALRIARSIRTERPAGGDYWRRRPAPAGDLARRVSGRRVRHPALAARAVGVERGHLQRAGSRPLAHEAEPTRNGAQVSPYGIFGTSPAMRKIVEVLPRVAPSRCPVLLYGERGTGREMLARAIHGHGRRPDAPFVALDCANASPQDLENELFGVVSQRRQLTATKSVGSIERVSRHSRLFEATGGTLFLQNLPEMPNRVQAKLHRVLRDREAVLDAIARGSSSTFGQSPPSSRDSRTRSKRDACDAISTIGCR